MPKMLRASSWREVKHFFEVEVATLNLNQV
jgi:hypothetical protein